MSCVTCGSAASSPPPPSSPVRAQQVCEQELPNKCLRHIHRLHHRRRRIMGKTWVRRGPTPRPGELRTCESPGYRRRLALAVPCVNSAILPQQFATQSSPSVTRRPFLNCASMPTLLSQLLISGPPPCTSTGRMPTHASSTKSLITPSCAVLAVLLFHRFTGGCGRVPTGHGQV